MFFRATIRRLFLVACAAVMLCAPAGAHVPRAPVPRAPLQVAQPALAGHWPSNTDTGTPVIHADPLLNAATYVITNRASPAVNSGVAVPGYYFDFFGNLRSPSHPCLGAIEVVREDDAPGINPGGVIYRVGASMPYTNIAHALAAVAVNCGTNAFTVPAIIQLEPGVYSAPLILSASNLKPTAANRLIIQGRPGTNAVFLGPVTVSAPNHTLWRGLILGGPVVCTNVIDAAISGCIVSGSVTFAQCEGATLVGDTFDYAVPSNTPVPRILIDGCTNALVRNNIFLAPTNAVVLVQTNGADAVAGNNLHWPPNLVTDTGSPVIHANSFLDAATYVITNLASPAVHSGVAVAGYYTDFYGNLRNPTNPCLGAIEFVLDDDGGLIINPGVGGLTGWTSVARDGGGRIIRRTYRGCVQNLAYDGRGRLTAWDWSGSSANATTYTYDHAGRRVLITETLGGRTTVTRCVYDGADVCTDFVDANNDGAVDRTRVYWLLPGMDRRIGFADITNGVATFYYYITDQVGSVLQIVNDAGTVVNQYDYDAWGNVRWGGSNTFEHVENRYLFQGREWDRNGGFYYFRNRIYLSERGEFASPDRNLGRGILGEMDGMGTLVFGGGDPVNCTDPTGKQTEFATWIASEKGDTETIAIMLRGSEAERRLAEAILESKGLSPNDILRDAQQREAVRYAALPEFSEFGRLMGGAIKVSAKAASIPVGIVAVAYVGSASVPYAGIGLEYAGRTAINQGYRGIQFAGQAVIKQWYRVAPLIPPVVEYADDMASWIGTKAQALYEQAIPLYQSAMIRMINGIYWYNFSDGKAAMAVRAVTGVLEDRLLQPEATIGGTLTGQPKFQYDCGVFANNVCQGIIQMTQWIYSGERQSDPQNDNAGTWDGIMPIGGITVNGLERVQIMLPDQK